MRKILSLFLLVLISVSVAAQVKQKYKLIVVAFYNLENYYDTVHNPAVNDMEFTPEGEKHYTSKIYWSKTKKLASVISKIGTDEQPATKDGPAIIGVAEIENDTVLNDLVHQPLLASRNYHFVHYDSRDPRGIDVALLYNPAYFKVEESKPLMVKIPGRPRFLTRDILWVKGKLDGETIHICKSLALQNRRRRGKCSIQGSCCKSL